MAHTSGPGRVSASYNLMVEAGEKVVAFQEALREHRKEKGLSLNQEDINKTGILGKEQSAITTTHGSPEVKRTTASPDFAGLMVQYFQEVGLKPGDKLGIGASASFPGLILAVLAAAETMDLEPVLITSLGSSRWGANETHFTWLDMEGVLKEQELIKHGSVATFYGGEQDAGLDMGEEGREIIKEAALRNEVKLYNRGSLEDNVDLRLDLYEKYSGEDQPAAFVNIGGAMANTGNYQHASAFSPGINRDESVPVSEGAGVMSYMAHQGIPVVHLFNVREIAMEEGISLDPYPLPEAGESMFYLTKQPQKWFLIGTIVCGMLALGLWLAIKKGVYLCK